MTANGKLRTFDLASVGGTAVLENATAAAWFGLVAAVHDATGIVPVISKDGAYRSYADQQRLTGTGNHKYRPGGSVHGWGHAVDINNWALIGTDRLDELAARFGFRRTIKGEPWHYEHDPALVPNPATPDPQEETMLTTRPPFFRKTAGPIENSMYLVILDTTTLAAVEIDGRTPAGRNEIESFQNQQGQQFDKSGVGLAYIPFVLTPANYDAIRSRCTVLTPQHPPFKS